MTSPLHPCGRWCIVAWKILGNAMAVRYAFIAAVVCTFVIADAVAAQSPHSSLGNLQPPLPSAALPDRTRVIPLHMARERVQTGRFDVSSGYRLAWEDDRLNPYRAIGTLEGRKSMNDVWTSTVPRHLDESFAERGRTVDPAFVYAALPEVGQKRPGGDRVAATPRGWDR